MYYQKAQAASNWWIEQMKKRCNSLYPDKIIQNSSHLVVIDHSLSRDFNRFKSLLTSEIQSCLEKNIYLSLTCYLLPNSALSNIAQKANIPSVYFPTRATMEILNGEITVGTNGDHLYKLSL